MGLIKLKKIVVFLYLFIKEIPDLYQFKDNKCFKRVKFIYFEPFKSSKT